ncbi:iron chelate uptake ABC transporter family permease subunit [Agreia bicolorata]|uniref:iron chelate uptake ABC transporter family permease subunit n=1 Tax=Agreia bicolorata TaxID=110935 RepID=UPI000A05F809|nr:iron chelate uptake ABC transporter family permease subunit [Agreia bicolorata]
MTLADLRPLPEDLPHELPPAPARRQGIGARRVAAAVIDLAAIAAPAVVGMLIVASLSDLRGGGSADRFVFGSVAVLASIAVLVGNLGVKQGRTGATVGKQWCGLIARNLEGAPLGIWRSLSPLTRRHVVLRETAQLDGFVPHQPDDPIRALRLRRIGWLPALVVLLLIAALASLAIGSRPLSIADVGAALLPPYDTGASDAELIVRSIRFPRTILAIVVGFALGAAGSLIQGHTRNALADPGILGISAGAACAVVVAIYVLGVSTPAGYVWFAFAGALAASAAVFGISSAGRGMRSPMTLVLGGAALAAFLGSITSALVLLDESTLDSYRFWIVGSVAGRGLDVLLPLLPFLAAGTVIALLSAPGLNLLATGDDLAVGLGLNIRAHRASGILAITLLAGAATAACGPIGFVGLVAPHMARAIVGSDYRWTVPYSGLLGALMLCVGDVVGRLMLRPGELQVGIVVALIGGPVFIALIRRRRLAAL